MKPIRDRSLLFIGIGFYDYERCIVERLRGMGARVSGFEESPRILQGGLFVRLLASMPWLMARLQQRHEARLLEKIGGGPFDQVLVIKGTGLSLEFLAQLRKALSTSQFILYQWDSLARLPDALPRFPYFDRVITFDRQDATTHTGLEFRPLFYRESPSDTAPDIDISFLGWLHAGRLEAIRRFETWSKNAGLRTKVYLYTGLWTWLKLVLRGQGAGIHVRPLPHARAMAISRASKCVLDLPHPRQSGLTMRAIETLGLQRKLLTSGGDIVNYDFYDAENVALIDSERIGIDPAFVRRAQRPVPEPVRSRYSLDAWIADVLDGAARNTPTAWSR